MSKPDIRKLAEKEANRCHEVSQRTGVKCRYFYATEGLGVVNDCPMNVSCDKVTIKMWEEYLLEIYETFGTGYGGLKT